MNMNDNKNMDNTTTKNTLPPYSNIFFHKLSNYLDTKLYYFGSVQRYDYFPNSSDIDLDIFTDNESSTITKLQSFLKLERWQFKKIIYHLGDKLIHGYKMNYEEPDKHLFVEISIYNERDKEIILHEHIYKINLPHYVSFILILLKIIYYNIPILPKNIYKYLKYGLMNMYSDKHRQFLVIS